MLQLGAEEHVLVRTLHHIVSDGWSQAVFNAEFRQLYEAFRRGEGDPLPPLAVQYADFAMWQREWFESGAWRKAWRIGSTAGRDSGAADAADGPAAADGADI